MTTLQVTEQIKPGIGIRRHGQDGKVGFFTYLHRGFMGLLQLYFLCFYQCFFLLRQSGLAVFEFRLSLL